MIYSGIKIKEPLGPRIPHWHRAFGITLTQGMRGCSTQATRGPGRHIPGKCEGMVGWGSEERSPDFWLVVALGLPSMRILRLNHLCVRAYCTENSIFRGQLLATRLAPSVVPDAKMAVLKTRFPPHLLLPSSKYYDLSLAVKR